MVSTFLSKYIKILLFSVLIVFRYLPVIAQPTDDQIKLGLIYNFIKNITWNEEQTIDTIYIATYGQGGSLHRNLGQLERLEVRGKPIRIKNIRSVSTDDQYHVLVIMSDQNDRIGEIYQRIQGENILLITDRCQLQRFVMLNFVYGTDSLVKFEVNSKNIEDAGLSISPKLILLGGSEIDIRNLYRETEKTLITEKERTGQYEKELMIKKQEIDQLNLTLYQLNADADIMRAQIQSQKSELGKLELQNSEQLRNIDDKNLTLDDQKAEIKKREAQLLLKEKTISQVEQKIEESSLILNSLKDEINNRQQTIEDQKFAISSQLARIKQQRSYLFLLALIIVLAIAVIFMIYHNYKNRQRRNEELEKQNALVKNQRDHIAEQNRELEMHRTQLEKLVLERTRDLLMAKEKAEEADRLKSSFLANMSHEIRTPLNAIIGFIDLIFNERISKKTRASYQQIVQSNSELLLQLINDILDLAMIESEQLKVERRDENLFSLINMTFSSCQTSKKNFLPPNLAFKLNLPDKSIRIRTDAIRFKQILLNLIDNAIKYTEKGSIEIGFTTDETMATIFVRDTGIGIPHDQQRAIFDRFTKIENPGTRLYRGIGLGLAIVKKLVEELGGDIDLESEQGKGSCFYFTQPLAQANAKTKAIESNVKSTPSLSFENKTILICEDDDSNFMLLEKVLSSFNVNILHAKNGQEAINLYTSGSRPDLILMDIKMPVMDGVEATKILKNSGYTNPIIAQTAYATSNEVQKYAHHFDDYITKPITREVLFKSLNQFLADPVS